MQGEAEGEADVENVKVRNILAELGPTPKIAILRGGGIGDFLSTTPALRALKRSVPQARITLITRSSLAEFCQRYSYISNVIVAPFYKGVNDDGPEDTARTARFFAHMKRERFDLALQWHGGGDNSNPFVLSLGARITAGFKGENAPPLDVWLPYYHHHHEILRYLDLVALLGGNIDGYQMELPLLPRDYAELACLNGIIDLNDLRQGKYVGCHVSAGVPSRRWPANRFAAVADALLDEFAIEAILLTAGPGQEDDAAAVLSQAKNKGRIVNLAGLTSLGALAALISQLRLYISNDSGPAHMSVALHTPTVVIYGSGNPINWAPLERAWHRPVADMSTPCRWMIHDGCQDVPTVPCLQNVSVDAVLREARLLLKQQEMLSWQQNVGSCTVTRCA